MEKDIKFCKIIIFSASIEIKWFLSFLLLMWYIMLIDLHNSYHSNRKPHKRLLWTIICQQIGNLEETDKFLETYKLPNLKNEERENPSMPITSKDLPSKKSLEPDGFTGKFSKHLKKN